MISDATPGPVQNEQGTVRPQLDPSAGYITIINTYNVAPKRADELLDALVRATMETLRFTPGFVSASFHVSLDGTRLVNYAQWRDLDAIKAAGADPEIAARIRAVGEIADSFAPVFFELRQSLSAASTQPLEPR